MAQDTTQAEDTIERQSRALHAQDVVWMGAPNSSEAVDPAHVELFVDQQYSENYVASHRTVGDRDCEWVAWADYGGRELVDSSTDESIGVVAPLQSSVAGMPSVNASTIERLVPTESRLRSVAPVLEDPPTIEDLELPSPYFDRVLLPERGHLEFRIEEAGDEAGRYVETLAAYTEKTVAAATGTSDDRIARSRIQEHTDYFAVDGATVHYGRPRYQLAKKLSDWGGKTGRYASLELWFLFELLLQLYPERVTWREGYEYHDAH